MKKIFAIIFFGLISCVSNAQMLDFEFLARMINMPEDSVVTVMLRNGWNFDGKNELMLSYIKGDDSYYESLGFNVHYGRVVLIVYFLPESTIDKFRKKIKYSEHLDSLDINGKYFDGYKTFNYGKDLMFAVSNEPQDGMFTVLIEAMHQTEFYTFNQCLDMFAEGKYAEITPSLWHIKEVHEKMLVPNEDDYVVTLVLLTYVYDEYYHDTNQSAKILYDSYNFLCKNGFKTSKCTRQVAARLGEKYRTLKQLPAADFYYQEAEKMFKESNDFSDEYMRLLSRMTLLYYDLGDKDKMLEYNDKLIDLYSQKYGDIYSTTEYSGLNMLINISIANSEIGRIDLAEKGYSHIISTIPLDSPFSIETFNYACHNLAGLKMQQQKYQEALGLLNKIIYSQTVSTDVFIQDQLTCYLFLDDKKKQLSI